MLNDYSLPKLYAQYTFDSFPTNSSNVEAYMLSKKYCQSPKKRPLVILKGGIGAGKSGIGASILNECKSVKAFGIAYVSGDEFKTQSISELFGEKNDFPSLRRVMENMDLLFLDDVGVGLNEASDSLKTTLDRLLEIIDYRCSNKLVTILALYVGINEAVLARIRNHLSHYGLVEIYLGEQSLRKKPLDFEMNYKDVHLQVSNLGKDWLLEKFERLLSEIDHSLKILKTPPKDHKKFQKRIFEEFGVNISKESELEDNLENIKNNLLKYTKFVDGLNFNFLSILPDGGIILHPPNYLIPPPQQEAKEDAKQT
ncbi:MAG: DnaA/Hda family protein [candidate division Zixibacteria bacterium]|nr:DnaA/Hda family protein [candidate division Zixibacteria bacterium]